MNGFEVSRSPSIHISHMALNNDGVWIIIRGSPVVTLWDPGLCLCILLYDTSTEEAAGWKRVSRKLQEGARRGGGRGKVGETE